MNASIVVIIISLIHSIHHVFPVVTMYLITINLTAFSVIMALENNAVAIMVISIMDQDVNIVHGQKFLLHHLPIFALLNAFNAILALVQP